MVVDVDEPFERGGQAVPLRCEEGNGMLPLLILFGRSSNPFLKFQFLPPVSPYSFIFFPIPTMWCLERGPRLSENGRVRWGVAGRQWWWCGGWRVKKKGETRTRRRFYCVSYRRTVGRMRRPWCNTRGLFIQSMAVWGRLHYTKKIRQSSLVQLSLLIDSFIQPPLDFISWIKKCQSVSSLFKFSFSWFKSKVLLHFKLPAPSVCAVTSHRH